MIRNRIAGLCAGSLAALMLASPGHAQDQDCGARLAQVEERMAELDLSPEQQSGIDQLVESARVYERIGREQSCLTVLAEVDPLLAERPAQPEPADRAAAAPAAEEEELQAQLGRAQSQLQQAGEAPPQADATPPPAEPQQAQAGTAPRIVIQQPPPQVTVRIPEPEITIEIPQPNVIVQMPEPNVQVQGGEPEVSVEVADPQITITQPPPRVQLQTAAAPAMAAAPEGQPQEVQPEAAQPQQEQQQEAATEPEQPSPEQAAAAAPSAQDAPAEQAQGQAAESQQVAEPQQAVAAEPQQAAAQQAAPPEASLAGVAAEDLVGRDVHNQEGDAIATVAAIVRQRDDEEPFAVLNVGGVLGVGAKEVAVALTEFEIGPEREALILPGATEEQLDELPPYNPAMYDSVSD